MRPVLLAMSRCPDGSTGDGDTGVILFWVFVAVGMGGAAYSLLSGLRAKPRSGWPVLGGVLFAVVMTVLGFSLMMWRILTCIPA